MKKIITFIVVGVLMLSTNAAVFANSTTTSMSVGTTGKGRWTACHVGDE